MRPVQRDEILGYVTYEEERSRIRAKVLEVKRARRVHVGEYLTLLFENSETVRYQVQEMVRAERIVREADIAHELQTYNELLGGDGELGCTLLVEIDDPVKRNDRLARWIDVPEQMYALLENGERVFARFDRRQVGDHKLSSVQYLKFAVGGMVPVAMGCSSPVLSVEAPLSPEQRRALAQDLESDGMPQ